MGILLANLSRIQLRSDIVMLQGGHMRCEKIYPTGSIFRLIDLYRMMPFYDHMRMLKAKGSDIRILMEQGHQHLPSLSGGFPNFSGAELTVDVSKPPLARVDHTSIFVDEKPLEDEREYTISAMSFVSTGKDGYLQFLNCMPIEGTIEVYPMTAIQDFIQLPKLDLHRKEFHFFKQVASEQTIDSLNKLYNSETDKIFAEFSEENMTYIGWKIDELLSRVNLECLQRLQMYTQAAGIVEIEGEFIFQLETTEPKCLKIIS